MPETTKATREAPTASQRIEELRAEIEEARETASFFDHPTRYEAQRERELEALDREPRYTVELTTEGWQIKDGWSRKFLADAYGDEDSAVSAVEYYESQEG